MKKLLIPALIAVLSFGAVSCENEIGCLYEVSCVDTSYDFTWKTFGGGYSGVCAAFEAAGFVEETTDVFSKKGTPTKTNALVKSTLEAAVASNESGLLKGIQIQAVFMNDDKRPVIATATYQGHPE